MKQYVIAQRIKYHRGFPEFGRMRVTSPEYGLGTDSSIHGWASFRCVAVLVEVVPDSSIGKDDVL